MKLLKRNRNATKKTARINHALWEKAKQVAKQNNMFLDRFIQDALEKYIQLMEK